MTPALIRLQLETIASGFVMFPGCEVVVPDYEKLATCAASSDDFSAELTFEAGQYVTTTTVRVVVGGVTFKASKREMLMAVCK